MPSPHSVSLLSRASIRAEAHIHTNHGPLLGRFKERLLWLFYVARFVFLQSRAIKPSHRESEFERHTRWRLDTLHAELAAFAQRQSAGRYKSTKFVTERINAVEKGAPPADTSLLLNSELEHLVIRWQHRGSDTVVFNSALGESYRSVVSGALASHETYAKLHGYDYASLQAVNHNQRPAPWYKVVLAAKMHRLGYKSMLFLDADCLITNYSITLPDLVERYMTTSNGACCCLAEDEGGINTGVLLMRSTPEMLVILDLMWNNTAFIYHNNWEQEALKDLLLEFPSLQKFFRIVRARNTFNTFPAERLHLVPHLNLQSNTWQPGDFLCHFSGIRGPVLERLIGQYGSDYPLPST